MYSMLTRSQRISHENLRLRDRPGWRITSAGSRATLGPRRAGQPGARRRPCSRPMSVRGVTLPNRIVVSPMAMYSAADGELNDFHLVHLGARAMGGAALVFGEMTCVSPDARITLGCLGLWNDEQAAGWKRIVDFVHRQLGPAKFGIQLGHAGRKGSTKVRVGRRSTEPLDGGNWPLISASALPYLKHSQVPKAMDRADMDRVTARFRPRDRYWPPAPAPTGWSCIAPTAICCRASCRRSPTCGTMNTAAATRTARASRSKCSAPCARYGPRTSRSRCACPAMTGPRAATRRTMPRSSRRCSRKPAPT